MKSNLLRNFIIVLSCALIVTVGIWYIRHITESNEVVYATVNKDAETVSTVGSVCSPDELEWIKEILESSSLYSGYAPSLSEESPFFAVYNADGDFIGKYHVLIENFSTYSAYLYSDTENRFYTVGYDGFQSIMNMPSLYGNFISDEPLIISLSSANKTVCELLPVDGVWNYMGSGNIYSSISVTASTQTLSAYPVDSGKANISFESTVTPDSLTVSISTAEGEYICENVSVSELSEIVFEAGRSYVISVEVVWNSSATRDFYGTVVYLTEVTAVEK